MLFFCLRTEMSENVTYKTNEKKESVEVVFSNSAFIS